MTGVRDEVEPIVTVEGHVKWFDAQRGYGFVVADAGGGDILLHANVLRNYGQGSVAEGARIRLCAQATPRGVQAVEVLEVVALAGAAAPAAPVADAEVLAGLAAEPARVKWFDKAKGYGFAKVFGRADDVFVHMEVVRHAGLADLQPGEAVGLRIVEGKRGRMAVQVVPWDSAPRLPA
jgi:CspA family cold shock protein